MSDRAEQWNDELAGRYELLGKAGDGGMATVYRARDLRHDRVVAIKFVRPELTSDAGADRFLAEIATTARLQHPNILPLFDSGRAAGGLYYVMPFVEGASLRRRLDEERTLPVRDAVDIVSAVAAGLAHAHQHGVIHRDIKPDNILLCDGVPVLADFGIALAGRGDARLTRQGVALGTVAYMSPEQAAGGDELDVRTDIYSLACVLFESLGGEPPHAAPTARAVLTRRLTEPPPRIRELRPDVPAPVEAALLRALATAPAGRFNAVADFARALCGAAEQRDAAVVVLRAEPRSYGVLMHEGDDDVLGAARAHLRRVVESAIESAGGVLRTSAGDALTAFFPDAASCLQCAAAAREAVAAANAALSPVARVQYRFGIAEDEAASAELAWSAPAGAILLDESLRTTREAPAGDATRTAPVGGVRSDLPSQLDGLEIPPPAQPSIALMPLACPAADADAAAIAEGLRIDITNALMKIGRIFLTAPSSMNYFRGAEGAATARVVGTRHVLEGAVRRAGSRVRVSMQLTDTSSGAVVWAERYDRLLDDAFELQDEIAARVITELDVQLSLGEQARVWRKCLTHPAAREHYYRGLAEFFESTRDSVAAARREFERVAQLVPESPVGPTWTALALWLQATRGWDPDAPTDALVWARRAVAMPDSDGQAHTVLGATLLLDGEWDEAIRVAKDSVRIRPGCNTANGILANVLLHCGDYETAVCHAKRAIRIGPVYPPWFLEILSGAQRELGAIDAAVLAGREILRLAPENVSGRLVLASALVRGRQPDEARQVVRPIPELEPDFVLDRYLAGQPFRSSNIRARLAAELREVGVG